MALKGFPEATHQLGNLNLLVDYLLAKLGAKSNGALPFNYFSGSFMKRNEVQKDD
jgi:hypothetical protein